MNAETNVTRGYGLLEKQLARHRARLADRLITPRYRSGRLLDIGCGVFPYFLTHTAFQEKFGMDCAVKKTEECGPMTLITHDLRTETSLPFQDNYFDVVTMLAVFEHIEPARLDGVLLEIRRVLKPGGMYVLTTPAKWTDRLLRILAKLRLVSPAEIEDHKAAYDHAGINSHLRQAGFHETNISCGYFELFMNLWATARKEGADS